MFLVVFFLHRSAWASEPRHRSHLERPSEGVTEDWLCLLNSPATEENRATVHTPAQHQGQHDTVTKMSERYSPDLPKRRADQPGSSLRMSLC